MGKKGDAVEVLGRGKKPLNTVVTSIKMFNTELEEGPAGYTVGVLCRGVERDAISRGQVICAPGATKTHTKFKASVYLSKKEVKMAMPGDDLNIECELIVETPIETGMRFAMREGGKTIGQGLVTEAQ